ncbi:MAG: hypothetical protein AUJ12_05000 [Alphaproteobacteria bacterium CG1_02_46_17]|nr:MAG: hypothetical protein AUJ12_05000 [Alphaproteobacteria bacterium CG1_02_46_17]
MQGMKVVLSSAIVRPFAFSLGMAFGSVAGADVTMIKYDEVKLDDKVVVVTKGGKVLLPDRVTIEVSMADDKRVRFTPYPKELGLKDSFASCTKIRAYNAFSWFVRDVTLLDEVRENYGDDVAYILSRVKIQNESNLSDKQVMEAVEEKVWEEVLTSSKIAAENADKLCLNQS